MPFFAFELDLNQVIFIPKLYQDMVKMYLYTYNEISSYNCSKAIKIEQTDTQLKLLPIHTNANKK